MPIPVIPVVAAAVVAVAAGAATLLKPKRIETLNVAILGGEKTGKTTLLTVLRQRTLGAGPDAPPAGPFIVAIGDNAVQVNVLKDVSGAADRAKFTDWKDVFLEAQVVLYLFRADLIGAQEEKHITAVKSDLNMMKDWADSMKSKAPRMILIGTWGDQNPQFSEDLERFSKLVRSSDPIKLGRAKFAKKAPVYVGSLASDHGNELVDDILSGLVFPGHRWNLKGS